MFSFVVFLLLIYILAIELCFVQPFFFLFFRYSSTQMRLGNHALIFLTLQVPKATNINFLLISIHNQKMNGWNNYLRENALTSYQIPSTYSLWKCIETSLENLYVDILGLKGLNWPLLIVHFVFVLVTSSSTYTLLAESLRSFLDKSGKRNRGTKKDRRRLC